MLLFRPVTVMATKSSLLAYNGANADKVAITELQRSVIVGCAYSCVLAAQDTIKVLHARCVTGKNRLPNWWYTTFCELAWPHHLSIP